MTVIKICGITNEEDAFGAVEAGADILGFIFCSSPREVTPGDVERIIRGLRRRVATVGVFTEESPAVAEIADRCGLTYIQLHGEQSDRFAAELGAERVIRAVRVKDEASVERLREYRHASFYLLDAYVPGRPGGTGQSFDWDLALGAERFGLPIILAGGLTPGNAADAVRRVRPFGIDVSSGVEAVPGKKDHRKMKELIENVRSVDRNA